MDWIYSAIPLPEPQFYSKALDRQAQLTKPPGSLGMLEEIAVRMAAMQGTETPAVDNIWVSVFVADHGIAEQSVSAFPQTVTAEMVRNFSNGGAAANVLSRYAQAEFEVVDVGLIHPVTRAKVINNRAGNGTADFSCQPAMNQQQLAMALNAGQAAVVRAKAQRAQLFIGGEMGIANTTSASAVAAALLNMDARQLTGAGTGLTSAQIEHKTRIIESALNKHKTCLESPLQILQTLGGFEIVALTGAYLYAAQQRLPVVVDGFISTVAALGAAMIKPDVKHWLFFAHCSHEKGHRLVLQVLEARPILALDMRLGEGSGALAAVPLMQMACCLHKEMATFSQAQITTG